MWELGLQKVSTIFTTDKSVSPCGNHLYKQYCLYWPPAFLLRIWSLGMCQAENAYVASSPPNLGWCCLVAKLCQTFCYSMDCSMPGFPVHHQLPDLTQTHVHRVMPSNHLILFSVVPFSSCLQSCPASGVFFQWVSSSQQVAKVLELHLQHQSFQWILRVDFLSDWLV